MNTRTLIPIALLATFLIAAAPTVAQIVEPILPGVQIASPISVPGQNEAVILSTSPTFRMDSDYDQPAGEVGYFRWLVKPALLPGGAQYVNTEYAYETNLDDVLRFDEEAWSDWTAWPDEGYAAVSLADLPIEDDEQRRIYYLFAVQVMGDDGVVSTARTYGGSVANFAVSDAVVPRLDVLHPLLGRQTVAGTVLNNIDLISGVDGGFTFSASAASYGEDIASYRWGWDVADPDDPNDPNWAVPPGLDDIHRHTPDLPFVTGVHTLTVQVLDTGGGETRFTLVMGFIPIPDPADQRPLLLVDDVHDSYSNAWPSEQGVPLDRDEYRDAFWTSVLDGAGGVVGFEPSSDVVDTEEQMVDARDIISYRSVVWAGRWVSAPNSGIASEFRPVDAHYSAPELKYVWLAQYQEHAGNLLYASNRAAMNFAPDSPYLMPVVFEAPTGPSGYEYVEGIAMRVAFGEDEFGPVHPRLYPYRDLGLGAVDITSPSGAYYAPTGQLLTNVRRARCAGLKGLVLDPDFVAGHMGGTPAFADTIWTDAAIDWRDDPMPAEGDVLDAGYLWGNDEFYDADVLGRDTPFTPQDCDGEPCVEPLWHTVSRFDWVQVERRAIDPEDTWPEGYYEDPEQPGLDTLCGSLALDDGNEDALTSDQVSGFVSRKYLDTKPSGAGDVVLGFDPYRFDNEAMRSAVRWILGEHFGLGMNP